MRYLFAIVALVASSVLLAVFVIHARAGKDWRRSGRATLVLVCLLYALLMLCFAARIIFHRSP